MSRSVDTAYREIRQAILKGQLRPGETLREQDLAERIGVSRTPVREAMNRLQNEGLVVLERYRKAYVAEFTEEDVREIWQLRARLEGHAAQRAATRITEADIARLVGLEDEMERLYDARGWVGSVRYFDELNSEFHGIIADAADSPRLKAMLHSSLELPASILTRYAEPVDDRIQRTFWQHREIIAALRIRNPEWAEAQMFAHLSSLLVPEGATAHGPEGEINRLSGADDCPERE